MQMMLLICLLIVSLIQGCGSDNGNNVEDIELIYYAPEGEIYLNAIIVLSFNIKPSQVMVNDVIMPKAVVSYGCTHEKGSTCYAINVDIKRFISEPGNLALVVTWTDDAGRKSSKTLNYKVFKRCCLPELIGSDPGNKAINVDADRLNEDGIRFLFSEYVSIENEDMPIKNLIIHVTADGKELEWVASQDSDDLSLILLFPKSGNELSSDQKVVVQLENVMDLAGNLIEPDGKLELSFTTAK